MSILERGVLTHLHPSCLCCPWGSILTCPKPGDPRSSSAQPPSNSAAPRLISREPGFIPLPLQIQQYEGRNSPNRKYFEEQGDCAKLTSKITEIGCLHFNYGLCAPCNTLWSNLRVGLIQNSIYSPPLKRDSDFQTYEIVFINTPIRKPEATSLAGNSLPEMLIQLPGFFSSLLIHLLFPYNFTHLWCWVL